MEPKFSHNKDFWAGIILIGIGAAAMFISRNYRFGSAVRMGPGFFPTLLGGVLTGFGLCIMIVGLLRKEKFQDRLSFRAFVLLSLSLVLFGILMTHAGLIPAVAALVFLSAVSGRGFKVMEVLLLTVVLTVVSVALFIWGLGLPYPLIRGF
jgi:putative tricarboxylic transport membrane protein